MIFISVAVVLIFSIVFWLFIPKATMSVLMFAFLAHHFPWITFSDVVNPHVYISAFALVGMLAGIFYGLVFDYRDWKRRGLNILFR